MTDLAYAPAGSTQRTPATTPLPDVPAPALHGRVRDQPVDGPGRRRPTPSSRVRQWQALVDTYRALGHEVDLHRPVQGLPDMVYAANGGFVDRRRRLRRPVPPPASARPRARRTWTGSPRTGFDVAASPTEVNEGEGDFLLVGDTILAGTGFRTDPRSHGELAAIFGREVVSLKLVDPRFYHLDTALAVLDARRRAHRLPTRRVRRGVARRCCAERFPDAILVDRRRRRGARPQRGQRRPQRRHRRRAPRAARRSCASAATTRSASTCPSCCSAAAASSAAPWSCAARTRVEPT